MITSMSEFSVASPLTLDPNIKIFDGLKYFLISGTTVSIKELRSKILVSMVSLVFLMLVGTVFGAEVCDKYHAKYAASMEKKGAGRIMDYDACKGYTNSIDCGTAKCYWNTSTSKCGIDVCLADGNFDNALDGGDLAILKKEFGRADCVNTPTIPGYLGAQVPKTGNTIDDTPGEDGDLQKGVAWPNPRFKINYCPGG